MRVLFLCTGNPCRSQMAEHAHTMALAHYRRVRDEIRDLVETLPGSLPGRLHEMAAS